MKRMNKTRIALGALITATILFTVSGVVNGGILGHEWNVWMRALGALNHAPSQSTGMMIWAVVSLVYGIAGMLIYGGFRARYGAGPRTAVIAGLVLWMAGGLTALLGHVALNDIPQHIALINGAAYLVCDPIAVLAGAFFYKE